MIKPRFKIIADPVHGFVSVPREQMLTLIQTPEVQRLRRIRQLGVGNLIFPGAEHTRFSHALGAMALMQNALLVLQEKGTPVSSEEHEAALAAALLHDIGHGPFSHTLEHVLIEDFEHEFMSRALIEILNRRFGGWLDLVLAVFDNTYERPFFHQLISSQLDMDRLDYLRRDSFHTGVAEGEIGVDRIIKTLRVHPLDGSPASRLVIETKGAYAVENFLFARRSMYWQVYLHKTVVSGDRLLASIIRRARALLGDADREIETLTSPALLYFLRHAVRGADIRNPDVIDSFCALDDSDILYSVKQWVHSADSVLADLSRRLVNRSFFRVQYLDATPSDDDRSEWKSRMVDWLCTSFDLNRDQAAALAGYYLSDGRVQHVSYTRDANPIQVISRHGSIRELSEMTDTGAIAALTARVQKPYVCYPKEVNLELEGLAIHENSDNV